MVMAVEVEALETARRTRGSRAFVGTTVERLALRPKYDLFQPTTTSLDADLQPLRPTLHGLAVP